MITKERKKELKEERKGLNKKIKELAEERETLRDEQRRYRVRGWKIGEILRGEVNDE